MKKRKLNSTNPKYMKKEETTTKVTRELICEAPTRTINGKLTPNARKAKIYSIRYE